MSLLRLELRQNPITGRHDLVVKLDSDEDLTSNEHEALHRKLVAQLVGSGVFSADQVGPLIVERISPQGRQDLDRQDQDRHDSGLRSPDGIRRSQVEPQE